MQNRENSPPMLRAVRRPKHCGIGFHYGLSLPDSRVAHIEPNRGIVIATHAQFACGYQVDIAGHCNTAYDQRAASRLYEAQAANRPYDLLAWNCETFANYVAHGKAVSHEVDCWLLIAAAIAVLVALEH